MRRASVISGGAQDQPIFQPVRLNVLPVEERVTVRSRMPGRLARGTCDGSNTTCSYTSSVMARRSCFWQTRAIASSSPGEKTLPLGLFGEFGKTARVRGETAVSRAAG